MIRFFFVRHSTERIEKFFSMKCRLFMNVFTASVVSLISVILKQKLSPLEFLLYLGQSKKIHAASHSENGLTCGKIRQDISRKFEEQFSCLSGGEKKFNSHLVRPLGAYFGVVVEARRWGFHVPSNEKIQLNKANARCHRPALPPLYVLVLYVMPMFSHVTHDQQSVCGGHRQL
ncbi:hypothetical protein GYMLUDRAFT_611821 [Collybiopsis luxurians FD-317 M1]|uniref:Uncharacterized protein n=1 Tax=Collybiopsis luxurians FD-317 M1 TaxID=944289 RepID=A0A0D0CDJ3_9AGAR|nr:hypothetical protein GYMLUDRAFT_611821 [Collybiopsis luxurians FD-317 M1]